MGPIQTRRQSEDLSQPLGSRSNPSKGRVRILGERNLGPAQHLLASIQYGIERFPNNLIPNTRLKLPGKNPRRIIDRPRIIGNLTELVFSKIAVVNTDLLLGSENLLRPVALHNNFDVQIRSRPNIVLGAGSTDPYGDYVTSSLQLAQFSLKHSSPWGGNLGWLEAPDTRQFQILPSTGSESGFLRLCYYGRAAKLCLTPKRKGEPAPLPHLPELEAGPKKPYNV